MPVLCAFHLLATPICDTLEYTTVFITCPHYLAMEIDAETQKTVSVDKFMTLVEKYANMSELTAPMLNELVEKIVVHKPVKQDGMRHVTIEIFFNYVGKISIPLGQQMAGILITV